MSAKWIRSQAWDDRYLSGPLAPVKWVLRLFSGIPLAVFLLALVAIYGVLASVPIGIVAMAPTWGFYALTVLAAIALGALTPTLLLLWAMRRSGLGRPLRFAACVLLGLGLTIASCYLWRELAWPHLRFDPVSGKGVEFFSDFVERYRSVQLRRLPYVEMSELEFYAWWPLRVILLAFVANMVITTLRRIEFTFPRVGVLLVHSGIVVIALGSVYYTTRKQEGDMLLLAGQPDDAGKLTPGRPETGFYDNTQVALWATHDEHSGWEQRKLYAVPRYFDYNLAAVPGAEMPSWGTGPGSHRDYGPLNIVVPEGPRASGDPGAVDPDVHFRVVGYACFADLIERWTPAPPGARAAAKSWSMREIEAVLDMTQPDGSPPPTKMWRLVPESPADRVDGLDLLAIEYTRGMSSQRWSDLGSAVPMGSRHAIVVQVPGTSGASHRETYAIEPGQEITVGSTGYRIKVQKIEPRPPFPIITPGYEGAQSSVVVLRIQPPAPAAAYDRWVYHRFPEISQDLLQELNERGMPKRRDADPAIRIAYLDSSKRQTYLDEGADGAVRALVRTPGGAATITTGLAPGAKVMVAPKLGLKLGARHEGVVRVEVPQVVHPDAREKERVGNHKAAAIALEISDKSGVLGVYWLPFTQYLSAGQDMHRRVQLSDGRSLTLAFGRIRHEFDPPMSLRLADFEMTPYPHSTTPRDYRSDVIVSSRWDGVYKDELRRTSLNDPLLVRTPFVKRNDLPMPANLLGWAMSFVAPNQYKFAQAGWDQGGWRESEAAVQRGELARPQARFTILGVGNNPGIYIIAAGAVMMSLGIPWAFYLKPWLIKRESRRLREAVARGEIKARGRSGPSPNGHAHESVKVGAAAGGEQS